MLRYKQKPEARPVIWILVSIGFIFLLGLVLHDAERHDGQEAKNAALDYGHGREQNTRVSPENEYAGKENHHAAQRDQWIHERRHNRVVTFLNAVTTGAAIVAAVVAGWAYTQTKRQADEARRQADAAEESVVAVQRAFIVVSGLKEEPIRENDKVVGVRFTPIIRNSGNTPAKQARWVTLDPFNVIHTRQIKEFRNSNPTDPDDFLQVPDDPPSVGIKRGILGPHDELIVGPQPFLNDQTFQVLLTNRIGKFYFGAIRYFDSFSKNERITKYCYIMNNISSGGADGFDLTGPAVKIPNARPFPDLCTHWNCADEDCEVDKQRYEEEKRQASHALPTVP